MTPFMNLKRIGSVVNDKCYSDVSFERFYKFTLYESYNTPKGHYIDELIVT